MADDDKRPKRAPSIMGDDERAGFGRRTPARGVGIPPPIPASQGSSETFGEEESSQNYEGEDLRAFRERKPTNARIARLEVRHDELAKVVTEIKSDVKGVVKSNSEVVGELRGMMQAAQLAAAQAPQRVHSDSLMKVVRETASETTTATLAERVLEDQRERVKFSNRVKLAILGGIVTLLSSGAFLHWVFSRGGKP